ncbi:MAG: hypothetical protein LLG37_06325 [Spirochaetia bacterium]|nr:hypothetical protein [Spirochaetia bacterium]
MTENQPQTQAQPEAQAKPDRKKRTGLYIVGIALAVLALGFFVLTKVNADASNAAGAISPILIIGGYILVGVGILVGWDE